MVVPTRMMIDRHHFPYPPARGPALRTLHISLRLALVLLVLTAAGIRSPLAATTTTATQPIRLNPLDTAASPADDDITPPLSIYESCQMINDASRLLSGKMESPPPATARRVDRILSTIILYVDRVDRAHPTLPFYAWEDVLAAKAPKDGWETQSIRVLNPIPQITALSIRARHGDIEIKYLAAIDKNQTKWEFNQTIHVAGDAPRPEICFLPLPTELVELRVTCRAADPKAERLGRLSIGAGVSSVSESARQANYYLQLARASLKAGKLAETRRHLREGYDLLREYQKKRRF